MDLPEPGKPNLSSCTTSVDQAVLLQAEHPEAATLEQLLDRAGYQVAHFGSQPVAVLAFSDFPKLMSRVRFHKTRQPNVRMVVGLENSWNQAKVTRALGVYGVRHFYRLPLSSEAVLDQVRSLSKK